MKKFFAMLLCLCLMIPCTFAEESKTEAEKWLTDRSLELAKLTNIAMLSDAYLSISTGRSEGFPDEFCETDFSSPNSIKIYTAPFPALAQCNDMIEQKVDSFGLPPELRNYVLKKALSGIPVQLLSLESINMFEANVIFVFSDTWLCPDFITDDAHVFLEYKEGYVIWAEFTVSDLGTINGQTHILSKEVYDKMDTYLPEIIADILSH